MGAINCARRQQRRDELWQWCREFHAGLGTTGVPMGLEAIEKEQTGVARCLDAYRAVSDTKESSVNYRKSPVVQRDFHGDTKNFRVPDPTNRGQMLSIRRHRGVTPGVGRDLCGRRVSIRNISQYQNYRSLMSMIYIQLRYTGCPKRYTFFISEDSPCLAALYNYI